MNPLAIIFLIVNSFAITILPRRLVYLPLAIGTCYMTIANKIDIGPFTFTVIRILIAVGFLRVIIRNEVFKGGLNKLDWLIIIWGIWAIICSLFYQEMSAALTFRLGMVYNVWGIYFLIRCICQTDEDVYFLIRMTAIILLPIALEMIIEQLFHRNLFAFLGGVSPHPSIREGNIRAQGPFRHSILAGTVGAVMFPMMVALWKRNRKEAIVGMLSCFTIVFCSRSSGPLASIMAGSGALFMWRFRQYTKLLRLSAILGYIALDIYMKAPAYYLMSRIPLVKGSTGWHRARLLESSLKHLDEWWLYGTDYTRHWMPTGVSWSPNHTDITNHYIQMGVLGGLPLMILFILTLLNAFFLVGNCTSTRKLDNNTTSSELFFIWSIGASLFANAATMISVSYFDQSFVFLYLSLGAIGSIWSYYLHKSTERTFS